MSPGGLFAGESDRTVGTGPRSAADARRQPAGPPSNSRPTAVPHTASSSTTGYSPARRRYDEMRSDRSRPRESSCYAPRPCHPDGLVGSRRSSGRVANKGQERAVGGRHEPGRAAPRGVRSGRRRTARPGAPARPSGARAGPGVEGPAAPVGPEPPSDVLVPGELPGRPRPRVHRPLVAAGRRRARPVQRPRHDPAPGLRRGAHRRRQRPQPVRPPPHRVQGRPGEPGREPDAPDRPAPRLDRRGGRLDRPRGTGHGRRRRRRRARPDRGHGTRTGRGRRDRPGRSRARLPPPDARPAPVRPDEPAPRRAGRPVPRRGDHRHPPRQVPDVPVRAHAEHVQHGPALRARLRGPDRLRLAGARRLRLRRREARPAVPPGRCPRRPGSRSSATPGTPAFEPAPRSVPAACRIAPASS